jgi:RNA polymerase sigma-70 factor (ECF subfamily)
MARGAARAPTGAFVALDEQDTSLWDAALISQGEALLRRASSFDSIGRFQLEAAIQSVHNARATSGVTDWTALTKFYGALVAIAPTLGSRVALAAAIGRADGPEAGLRALDAIDGAAIPRFQPAWATRAHLLAEAGRRDDADAAYDTAIALSADPGIRAYLQARRESPAS